VVLTQEPTSFIDAAMLAPLHSISLATEAETQALGARLAFVVQPGDFIALRGPLGAGKTTLARGLICAFIGEGIEVPSPTFTLVQRYEAGSISPHVGQDLMHFDLYRLEDPDDIWELGWEEIGTSIALVEWPQKAGSLVPTNHLDIEIKFEGDHRIACFSAPATSVWKERLHDF
jgi:tRNA threonylcarbamoyl adenosine modification protein YjeE